MRNTTNGRRVIDTINRIPDHVRLLVAEKVRTLKEMAHEAIVTVNGHWAAWEEARNVARTIASGPSDTFDQVKFLLELSLKGDTEAYWKALEFLCPVALAERKVRVAAEKARQDRIDSLMEAVRATFSHRKDVIYHARSRIIEIGRCGGDTFNKAISLAKFAGADRTARLELMELFFPDAAEKLAIQPVQQAVAQPVLLLEEVDLAPAVEAAPVKKARKPRAKKAVAVA